MSIFLENFETLQSLFISMVSVKGIEINLNRQGTQKLSISKKEKDNYKLREWVSYNCKIDREREWKL